MQDNTLTTKTAIDKITTAKITILLVDDHSLFRSGLKYLLNSTAEFVVVGEAVDGLEAIKLATQLNPDIILMDLDMPVMNGKEALTQLIHSNPELKILMLTVSEDAVDLADCMRLGASGYLLKNINPDFLVESLKQVVNGDNVLSPEMTSKLISNLRTPKELSQHQAIDKLTQREFEILLFLSKGVSNKTISRELDLAESTIKVYVQNVLRKLHLSSRVQAAIYVIESGIDKQAHLYQK